ncbi:hypothetical protein [Microvirga massiliensis]|uniref:hypothetical protein n=1 Tax=Microvirga massiliensis TaxID=1033741 RepID=UPI000AE86F88|nr:hypothetical protein [Microvirga massiliensis]
MTLAANIQGDILRAIPHHRGFAISITGIFDDLIQKAIVRAPTNLDQFTPGTSMQE